MELSFVREVLFLLLLFSLFVAWKVRQRSTTGLGCVGFGYVALVVFVVGMFAVLITSVLTSKTTDSVSAFIDGEKCVATVVAYSSYDSEDDEGNSRRMHTPMYRVQTDNGLLYEVEADYSSGGIPIIGDEVSVYFNEKNQCFVELSASTLIMFCGVFIMWIVVVFAFLGMILYAYNYNMTLYFRFLQVGGIYFFLPFVMICFEALLIYSFFYGNTTSRLISAVLLFFILALGLGILGFIKQLKQKGLPKWRKTGAGSWSADWEDDQTEKKIKDPNQKPKKMVPLNEKYLEKKDSYSK